MSTNIFCQIKLTFCVGVANMTKIFWIMMQGILYNSNPISQYSYFALNKVYDINIFNTVEIV